MDPPLTTVYPDLAFVKLELLFFQQCGLVDRSVKPFNLDSCKIEEHWVKVCQMSKYFCHGISNEVVEDSLLFIGFQ